MGKAVRRHFCNKCGRFFSTEDDHRASGCNYLCVPTAPPDSPSGEPDFQEQAKAIVDPCTVSSSGASCTDGEWEADCGCPELVNAIAAALEDARINASVPIHLSRPEHPKAKWCDGAFLLRATTDRDKYTCVPCALAFQRAAYTAGAGEPVASMWMICCDEDWTPCQREEVGERAFTSLALAKKIKANLNRRRVPCGPHRVEPLGVLLNQTAPRSTSGGGDGEVGERLVAAVTNLLGCLQDHPCTEPECSAEEDVRAALAAYITLNKTSPPPPHGSTE